MVGLHTTSPANTSKWGALEIDWHGPESTPPETNLRAAVALHDQLRERGLRPLLTDSNGKGGFHVRFFLSEPTSTARVFRFLRALTDEFTSLGLEARPETFPKQAAIREGGCGNWLRVPGRHHSRDHWSRVWGGNEWLRRREAIEFILALDGDCSSLIPECPPPPEVEIGEPQAPIVPSGPLGHRIVAYLSTLPNLAAGQGRDDVAYGFVCFLVRDLALSDEDALSWLHIWDAGNRPPKGDDRLREIIASAHEYGTRPYGAGLRSRRRELGFTFEI